MTNSLPFGEHRSETFLKQISCGFWTHLGSIWIALGTPISKISGYLFLGMVLRPGQALVRRLLHPREI